MLLITTDYPHFLREFYGADPELPRSSYAEQMRRRNETLFANADFYSKSLTAAGAVAADIYMNNETLQRRWASENGMHLAPPREGWIGRAKRLILQRPPSPPADDWVFPILARQIDAFRPDVIVNEDMHFIRPEVLDRIRGSARLLVWHTNSARNAQIDYGRYDLVLTAFPNYVRDLSAEGVRCRLSRLCFEPAVLDELGAGERTVPVSFVGSLSPYHADSRRWLEHLCRERDIAVWGPDVSSLPADSPIRRCYRGRAWGRQMLKIFCESEIVLNHELPISHPFGANMRFYEATGCGALLLTDRRDVSGMFEPEREIAFYDDAAHCVARIDELLADAPRRQRIAEAGRDRTLREHTYAARAKEMIGYFEQALGDRTKAQPQLERRVS